jgi:hypothetical protein
MHDAGSWRRRSLVAQLTDVGAGLGMVIAGATALVVVALLLAAAAALLSPAAGS